MKRSVRKMVEEYRLHWRHYVFQSLLATLAVFIVLCLLSMQHAVIVASLGATAFIVFTMPDAITAQARNVIGGHAVGLSCGIVFSLIPLPALPLSLLIYSLAVGASVFIMVVTDTEHPPAAGTALGTAIAGASLNVFSAVILSCVVFSLLHRYLRPHLRDLT